MTVVVIAVPDIPDAMQGDKTKIVTIYENGTHKESRTFLCLEEAECWVHSTWPGISTQYPMSPPVQIDGYYYDDPEIVWVGLVR